MESRDSELAWLRTHMAGERTLMAWLRTSASMIGFGFTIFTFFQQLKKAQEVRPARYPWLPEALSAALLAIGTLAALAGFLQNRRAARFLHQDVFGDLEIAEDTRELGYTSVIAILLFVVGLAALSAVIVRVT